MRVIPNEEIETADSCSTHFMIKITFHFFICGMEEKAPTRNEKNEGPFSVGTPSSFFVMRTNWTGVKWRTCLCGSRRGSRAAFPLHGSWEGNVGVSFKNQKKNVKKLNVGGVGQNATTSGRNPPKQKGVVVKKKMRRKEKKKRKEKMKRTEMAEKCRKERPQKCNERVPRIVLPTPTHEEHPAVSHGVGYPMESDEKIGKKIDEKLVSDRCIRIRSILWSVFFLWFLSNGFQGRLKKWTNFLPNLPNYAKHRSLCLWTNLKSIFIAIQLITSHSDLLQDHKRPRVGKGINWGYGTAWLMIIKIIVLNKFYRV